MRDRKEIDPHEKIACLLVELLPPDLAQRFYDAKVPAESILKLFPWDHYPIAHTDGGPDVWYNLRPLRPDPHQEHTNEQARERAKTRSLKGLNKQKPKRKIPSRPLASRNSLRERR